MNIDVLGEKEYIPLLPFVRELSEKIKDSVLKIQNCVFMFHGEQSEYKMKHLFQNYEGEFKFETDVYIKDGKNIYIEIPSPSSISSLSENNTQTQFSCSPGGTSLFSSSFIFNGLQNNYIHIDKKVNHIMLRECKNVTLELSQGTVSGIDILKCSNVKIKTLLHNYTNIEYVSSTDMFGDMNSDTKIYVRNSMDIKFENISLPVNVFTSRLFTQRGFSEVSSQNSTSITLLKN